MTPPRSLANLVLVSSIARALVLQPDPHSDPAGELPAELYKGFLGQGTGRSINDIPTDQLTWAIRALQPEPNSTDPGQRDLVFMHVPYNFGHTLEYVGALDTGLTSIVEFLLLMRKNMHPLLSLEEKWKSVNSKIYGNPRAEIWGAVNPVLMMESSVKCPMYLTPQRFWPKEVAKAYFGTKKIMAILRDPYERLIALFRGSAGGETGGNYGGDYSQFHRGCNVDGAVRFMMESVLYENKYAHGCTFVPQHEYFEGEFAATEIIDNRLFPYSANHLLKEHGYEDLMMTPKDALHVTGCTQIWAANLSETTKAMVRQVYRKDFDLLCKTFGYCDDQENTCLQYVPMMCPKGMSKVPEGDPLEPTKGAGAQGTAATRRLMETVNLSWDPQGADTERGTETSEAQDPSEEDPSGDSAAEARSPSKASWGFSSGASSRPGETGGAEPSIPHAIPYPDPPLESQAEVESIQPQPEPESFGVPAGAGRIPIPEVSVQTHSAVPQNAYPTPPPSSMFPQGAPHITSW